MAWAEKYVTVTGAGAHDGSSEANAWTFVEAIAAVAAGNRVNVKAGTYANTTNLRQLTTDGTTTAPIWWRGYASTIGDLDDVADGAASGPQITFTTNRFLISATHQIISSMSFTSQDVSSGGTVQTNAANIHIDRCRIENTAADSLGYAMGHATISPIVTRSWLKATTTADQCINNIVGGLAVYSGCVIIGGINGLLLASAGSYNVNGCVFRGQGTGDCIRVTAAGTFAIVNNTFYDPDSDGIEFTAVPSGMSIIANNVFNLSGGYDIKNSSGANTNFLVRLHNLSYSPTSGHESGFGDSPAWSANTDSASSVTGSTDMSLVSGSNARATALPGKFENESYSSYRDRGAVQHQDSGGGSSGPIGKPVIIQNIGTY